MISVNRWIIGGFLFLTFCFFSCEKFVGDNEIILDPNRTQDPDLRLLLSTTEVNIANLYGGFFSRINSSHVQHVEPIQRSISTASLFTDPARFDEPWTDFYASIFIELNTIQSAADENSYYHCLAIANILKSFALMIATDVWDDIPNNEAGLGFENLNPRFESQEIIYGDIHELLDNAIALLNGPIGGLDPSNSDIIYSGDPTNWVKAAHALKARAYLHFADYRNALTYANLSFESTDDNMGITYPGLNYPAPWFLQNESRTGDFELSPTLRDIMLDLNDTSRLSVLDQPFYIDHPYLKADYGLDLISYREIQFIIAEAGLELGLEDSEIRMAYLNGIAASFQELGFDPNSMEYPNYVSQIDVDPGQGNIDLDHILTQKYLALFVQPESYSDWRRRNIPSLIPISGASIPVRWPYSKSSLEFNLNAPASNVDVYTDRVFWDND